MNDTSPVGVEAHAPGKLHRLWKSGPMQRVMALPGLRILEEKLESDQLRKMIRYAGVSVVFVPLGQLLVQMFVWIFDVPETWAVLITASVLTVPNLLANKHYVWKYKSKDNRATELTVFWLAAVLGTAFAIGFVYIAGQLFPKDESPLVHAIAIFFAQLLGYGIVWVLRFLFLDRWLFKATHHGQEPTEDEVEDLHRDLPI